MKFSWFNVDEDSSWLLKAQSWNISHQTLWIEIFTQMIFLNFFSRYSMHQLVDTLRRFHYISSFYLTHYIQSKKMSKEYTFRYIINHLLLVISTSDQCLTIGQITIVKKTKIINTIYFIHYRWPHQPKKLNELFSLNRQGRDFSFFLGYSKSFDW